MSVLNQSEYALVNGGGKASIVINVIQLIADMYFNLRENKSEKDREDKKTNQNGGDK